MADSSSVNKTEDRSSGNFYKTWVPGTGTKEKVKRTVDRLRGRGGRTNATRVSAVVNQMPATGVADVNSLGGNDESLLNRPHSSLATTDASGLLRQPPRAHTSLSMNDLYTPLQQLEPTLQGQPAPAQPIQVPPASRPASRPPSSQVPPAFRPAFRPPSSQVPPASWPTESRPHSSLTTTDASAPQGLPVGAYSSLETRIPMDLEQMDNESRIIRPQSSLTMTDTDASLLPPPRAYTSIGVRQQQYEQTYPEQIARRQPLQWTPAPGGYAQQLSETPASGQSGPSPPVPSALEAPAAEPSGSPAPMPSAAEPPSSGNVNNDSSPPAGNGNNNSSPPTGNVNNDSSPPAGNVNNDSSPPTGNVNNDSSPPAGNVNNDSSPPAGNGNNDSSPPAGNVNNDSSPPTGNDKDELGNLRFLSYILPPDNKEKGDFDRLVEAQEREATLAWRHLARVTSYWSTRYPPQRNPPSRLEDFFFDKVPGVLMLFPRGIMAGASIFASSIHAVMTGVTYGLVNVFGVIPYIYYCANAKVIGTVATIAIGITISIVLNKNSAPAVPNFVLQSGLLFKGACSIGLFVAWFSSIKARSSKGSKDAALLTLAANVLVPCLLLFIIADEYLLLLFDMMVVHAGTLVMTACCRNTRTFAATWMTIGTVTCLGSIIARNVSAKSVDSESFKTIAAWIFVVTSLSALLGTFLGILGLLWEKSAESEEKLEQKATRFVTGSNLVFVLRCLTEIFRSASFASPDSHEDETFILENASSSSFKNLASICLLFCVASLLYIMRSMMLALRKPDPQKPEQDPDESFELTKPEELAIPDESFEPTRPETDAASDESFETVILDEDVNSDVSSPHRGTEGNVHGTFDISKPPEKPSWYSYKRFLSV